MSTIAESLWNEGHGSKTLKLEDKEKELKGDLDTGKENDRYKEKYWGKSIQELDLSNCQRCTPSYRLLPEDVRNSIIVSSCRLPIIITDFTEYELHKSRMSLSLFSHHLFCSIQSLRLARGLSLGLRS